MTRFIIGRVLYIEMNKERKEWYRKEFEEIHKEITSKEELSHYDFLRIRNFKLRVSSMDTENNIKKITREAFNLSKQDKIGEAIKKLCELNGVRIPIASTILSMKYPNKYCIIDRKVLKAIGKGEWIKDYEKNTKTYLEYLLLMRKKSKEKNLVLRDYERSFFESI